MWWVHTRLDFSVLPDRRFVIEFRFVDDPRRFWIMRDSEGPSICLHDPGFGVDATVVSDLSTMHQVWLGKLPLKPAIRSGKVELGGTPAVVRRLPAMMQLSPIAYACQP
jgi:hypothetical protein